MKTPRVLLAFALLSSVGNILPARAQETPVVSQPVPPDLKVNLLTLRGVVATADKTVSGDPNDVLHPHYGEIRFHSNYGPTWWMAQLPGVFKVSNIQTFHRSPMVSMGYRVKVSTRALSDDEWAKVKPVWQFSGELTKGNGENSSSGSWKAVPARFVRLEWIGHNGVEAGGAGHDHPDLLLSRLFLWGPNSLDVTPLLSSALSSMGARISLAPSGSQEGADTPALGADDLNDKGSIPLETRMLTNGAGKEGAAKPNNTPAHIVVTLAKRSTVRAVGFTAVTGRGDRATEVKIYTSPADMGDNWQLQKSAVDLTDTAYHEFSFDKTATAKRVRFDIARVADAGDDKGLSNANLGRVYVYAQPQGPDFSYSVAKDATLSATIFDAKNNAVRSLFQFQPMKAGKHEMQWDGLDDQGKAAPSGALELRLIGNVGRFDNIAVLGNTGNPTDADHHIPVGIRSLAIDGDGALWSANGWDEAGHDWQKWDAKGQTILDAKYAIRNGNPNGLPYQIACDDRFTYVGYHAHGDKGSQWIERFDRTTGAAVKWDKAWENGLIRVYPPSEGEWPLTDIAVAGDLLVVGDKRGNRILKFDKTTGQARGEFAFDQPGRIVVGPPNQLWIAQGGEKVVVTDLNGAILSTPIAGAGEISGLALSSPGKLLVSDRKAGQLRAFQIEGTTAKPLASFGQKAKPGDAAPDHFYGLQDVAAASDGGVVTSDALPRGGSRIVRWAPDAVHGYKMQWQQMGLEFTGNANYASEKPDEIISTYAQRYAVNHQTGAWKFAGNLDTGGNFADMDWHGAPRWAKLGQSWFFFHSIGDGMEVYRRVGDELRMAALVGGRTPDVYNKQPDKLGQWTWSDANGDGKVGDSEIVWFKKPGAGSYSAEGMNADAKGNIVFCDQTTGTIQMLPMLGLNAQGNPTYDWAKPKQLAAADDSKMKFLPLMAVRSTRQVVYAFGRSDGFAGFADSGPAWMGGWTLAKFDKNGVRLWITRLPQHCVGMDIVPGRTPDEGDNGVVVGHFANASLFYISPDGIALASALPGKAASNQSGWLDNTASVAVNRDPRDGLVDVFAEEDYAHRILWYRLDDSKIITQRQPLIRAGTGGATP